MTVDEQPVAGSSDPKDMLGWIKAVAFGSSARVFALGSQFVVLLMLSRVLSRDAFGDMMVAFAFYRTVSFGVGTGLGNMMLYHIGRSGGDLRLNCRLHRTATLLGLAVSLFVAVPSALLADQVASLFAKPGLALWLVHMAPLAVFSTLSFVAMGSLDGRSRINQAIIITEVVPNGIRLVALPVIAFGNLSPVLVAHVMWISVSLPWAYEGIAMLSPKIKGLERLKFWDIRYAGLFTVNAMLSQQLQGIDMLVVGALFTSELAAGYAIASRVATLFPFLQQIVLRNFSPRAGYLLSSGKGDELNEELTALKRWSIVTVGGLAGSILIVAPILFPFFGDYLGAMPVLVALAAPAVVRSLFAGNDVVLKMSGRAGYSFAISISSVIFLVAIPYWFHEYLGILSLPVGMVASALLLNPITAVYLSRRGTQIVQSADVFFVLLGCATLAVGLVVRNPTLCGVISGLGLLGMAVAGGLWKRQIC